MKVQEIMETIMTEQGKTKAELGRAIGLDEKKATDLIGKRIKQDNISVKLLGEMLSAMGYTMVIVPSGPKVKDGEYEVTINE